jgi:hypothetical protein
MRKSWERQMADVAFDVKRAWAAAMNVLCSVTSESSKENFSPDTNVGYIVSLISS